MSYLESYRELNWDEQRLSIYSKNNADVVRALNATRRTLEDFKALISPAAEPFLEQMAQLSKTLTQQRFGNTMQLYAPLYLSNVCSNICTYCGFSAGNKLRRKTLSEDEIRAEGEALRAKGFEHILLVTGEAPKTVGVQYIKRAVEILSEYFAQISIEVQPMESHEYAELQAVGLHSVLVYQECYHRGVYAEHHLMGSKMDFDYRLDTPDRLGEMNIHKMGLGALLGLADWRVDSFYTAHHLSYLEKRYWRSRYSVSFPRLRPCEGDYEVQSPINDRQMVQLICAWRLFNQELELSLSTRESQKFRDNVAPLGVTTMSTESQTQPGGYAEGADKALEQFEIDDNRSTPEVAKQLQDLGYQVVFKDWQAMA